MSSRFIFLIGFIVSAIYILSVVYFYTPTEALVSISKKDRAKFLYILSDKKVDIVSKLSKDDEQSSLVLTVKNLCKEYECKDEISFDVDIDSPSWLELVEKLINFSLEKKLTSSSLVVSDNSLEINFLLTTRDELMKLSSLYAKYKNDFFILDKSSIVKFYSIEKIEEEVNQLLKGKDLEIESLELEQNSINLLNQAFRRLRELGKVKVLFLSPLDEVDTMLVREYILKNYPWIEEVSLKNDNEIKIKIEEVVR